jgi:hypothetical protein
MWKTSKGLNPFPKALNVMLFKAAGFLIDLCKMSSLALKWEGWQNLSVLKKYQFQHVLVGDT